MPPQHQSSDIRRVATFLDYEDLELETYEDLELESTAMHSEVEAGREWEIHQVDNTQWPLAVCLDGSPGGYFVRKGVATDSEAEKVLFFMEGYGWCLLNVLTSTAHLKVNCLKRADTYSGSTASNETEQKLASSSSLTEAYFSTDPLVNPAFHDWTIIHVRNCEGSAFSGRLADPVEVENDDGTTTSIYFRGNYILEAIVSETLSSSIRNISHVVVGGDASGAMAVYLHGSQIGEWVEQLQPRRQTQVALFPDAGFFPDWSEPSSTWGNYSFQELMKNIFTENNATDSLPKKCLEEREKDDHYTCMFPQNTVQYFDKPYFIAQPDYDHWQLRAILGWNESVGIGYDSSGVSWSEVTSYAQNIKTLLLDGTDQLEVSPASIFMPPCLIQNIASNDLYTNMTAKGVACNKAIKSWLDEWMMDDPNQKPRKKKHYNLIHKDDEGPFSKEECAAGAEVMTEPSTSSKPAPERGAKSSKSKGKSSKANRKRQRNIFD